MSNIINESLYSLYEILILSSKKTREILWRKREHSLLISTLLSYSLFCCETDAAKLNPAGLQYVMITVTIQMNTAGTVHG